MLLERIDIDQHGPLRRVHLGPFSHQLNAIYGPPGSGKTTVLHFLRDTLLEHPLFPGSYVDLPRGRVVWAGPDGLLHCVRQSDGRVTYDLEPRDGYARTHSTDARKAVAGLPPAVVEEIMLGRHEHGLHHAINAAAHADLAQYRPVGTAESAERASLRARIVELERLLADTIDVSEPVAELELRRQRLTAELAEIDSQSGGEHGYTYRLQRDELRRQEADLEHRISRLRTQELELRRLLDEIDLELRSTRQTAVTLPSLATQTRYAIAETHRRHLQELDTQLIRWRRTLRDIQQLRQRLKPDLNSQVTDWSRRGTADAFYRRPSTWVHDSLHALESRLEATQREIDWLVSRYALDNEELSVEDPADPYWGRSHRSFSRGLRSLKHRLQQINQRLHEEAHGHVGSTRRADWLTETQAELGRCEADLLASIEQLIRHRDAMLERIAREQNVPVDQVVSAFGDWRHCQDHPHLYQWLLSDNCPPHLGDRQACAARAERLEQDRAEYSRQLDRTINHLENQIAELRDVRSRRHQLPGDVPPITLRSRNSVYGLLCQVRDQLNRVQLRQHYSRELAGCRERLAQLPIVQPIDDSGLMQRASYWMSRLTAGTAQHIRWGQPSTVTDPHFRDASAIQIDGRLSSQCPPEVRYLAGLAVRMAVANQLARQGRVIPLILETPSHLERDSLSEETPPCGYENAPSWEWIHGHQNGHQRRYANGLLLPQWLDAVLAFAESGQQTILMTRQREVADRVAAVGGTVHHLKALDTTTSPKIYSYRGVRPRSEARDVNVDFDLAWREAYGLYDNPDALRTRPVAPIDRSESHSDYRDGDYISPNYASFQVASAGQVEVPASAFFLTADSPVDQAPSVDAVAGARLRGVGISRIGQLLIADPARLADALGMQNVVESTVRRWQNEARLVCRVPQLRAFDARVLVGCGITDPKQLAAMHPGELLNKVESFLATERGRQILRSGSSYELSRITSWIAAANRSVSREARHGERSSRGRRGQRQRDRNSARSNRSSSRSSTRRSLPALRTNHESQGYVGQQPRPRPKADAEAEAVRWSSEVSSQPEIKAAIGSGQGSRRARGSGQGSGSAGRSNRQSRAARASSARSVRRRERPQRDSRPNNEAASSERAWRFYLQRDSSLPEAPTIGPRTAQRLERIGLQTVDDLLQADPDQVAEKLRHRRITGETIRQWQCQATLVCRIPMLRGHDAQLLVAAGVRRTEELMHYDPRELLGKIDEVVGTVEGRRILRGSPAPDLKEIQDWILYANHHRELKAA